MPILEHHAGLQRRFAMSRLWAIVLALMAAYPVAADLEISLELEHSTILKYEPVLAFVTIRNMSNRRLMISDDAESAETRILLAVSPMRGNRLRPRSTKNVLTDVDLAAGETGRYLVSLSRFFDIREVGGYQVSIELTWEGLRYASSKGHFDVSRGLPLSQLTRQVPDGGGRMRAYNLCYLAREGGEVLFVQIRDEGGGGLATAFALGPLVRVFDPVLHVDARGVLTVVHQSGRRIYTRSLLQSSTEGVRLVDQSYEKLQGRVSGDGRWVVEDEESSSER